jgi:hypothetical protein
MATGLGHWRYIVLSLNEYRAWRVVDVDGTGQVGCSQEEEDTVVILHSGDTRRSNHGTASDPTWLSSAIPLLAFGMGVYIFTLQGITMAHSCP